MSTTPHRITPAQGHPPAGDPELAAFAALLRAHRRGDRREAMRQIRELRRHRWSVCRLQPRGQGGEA